MEVGMRKLKLLTISIFFIALITSCGSGAGASADNPDIKLSDIASVYRQAGINVDEGVTFAYQLRGASNGITFYIDNKPIKIYEFASSSDYKKCITDNPDMKDFSTFGNFVLAAESGISCGK
ncbi:hypothetical protein QE152_g39979 [Popillia japonica]|uniref:Uncharacterized protein n=1 Tax=Popillia japonica TaxID=7064 RepID=A0AAW1HSM2_POPJA